MSRLWAIKKPVAVVEAGGGGGTRRAQAQVRAARGHPGALVLAGPEVAVARAREKFDGDLRLVDPEVRARLAELLERLSAEVTSRRAPEGAKAGVASDDRHEPAVVH